jgi:hypothetical protein
VVQEAPLAAVQVAPLAAVQEAPVAAVQVAPRTSGSTDGASSGGGGPYKCPWPGCSLVLDTEQQILNHKAVLRILEKRKLANNQVVQKVPSIRSNMLDLPSAYK